jgi:hypothetical protein
LQWQPELSVRLIEAGGWGLTILDAALAATRHRLHITINLLDLTLLLSTAVVAALPGVIGDLLERIATLAAVSGQLLQLMQALLPLARAARYGDVRGTPASQQVRVFDGIFARVAVGLPGACLSLDDDAAAMVSSMNAVQGSVGLLDDEARRHEWHAVLRVLSETEHIHGLVRGRCCRLLMEGKVLDSAGLLRQAHVSLAPVVAPPQAAAWIEGLLQGNGMLLLHQDGLWRALDTWLCTLDLDVFTAVLLCSR